MSNATSHTQKLAGVPRGTLELYIPDHPDGEMMITIRHVNELEFRKITCLGLELPASSNQYSLKLARGGRITFGGSHVLDFNSQNSWPIR